MPLFGSHLSVAGGFYKAVDQAAEFGMDTVQIFTAPPRQYTAAAKEGAERWQLQQTGVSELPSPLKQSAADRFQKALQAHGLQCPCAHDSYLINLGSPDSALREKSLHAYVMELERAEMLGLAGVVMHPGSYVKSTEEEGLAHIIAALNEAHRRTQGYNVQTWVEATAGQGTNLGYRFEQLGQILQHADQIDRFGVCIDTCHIFAAGYGLRTLEEYAATMQELDDHVGLEHVRAFHLNDSKKPQGSRVDRHEHIGEGELGLEPFRFLMNDARFAHLPMYLETKKEKRDGVEMDAVNLQVLKSLIVEGQSP